jgi:signal transduction histidine kinase
VSPLTELSAQPSAGGRPHSAGAAGDVDRLACLRDLTAALAEAGTAEEVAQAVLPRAAAALGADAARLALLSADGTGLIPLGAGGTRLPLDAPAPLAAAVRQRTLVAPAPGPADGATLALPLLAAGRAVGGLEVRFPAGRAVAEADRDFLLTLAGLCAQALERARLDEAARAERDAPGAAVPGTRDGNLAEQRRWLEAVVNLMPVPVLFIEPGTARVTFANRAADELAGGEFPKGRPGAEYHTVYHCTDAAGTRIPDAQMPGVRAARGERLDGFEMDWHLPAGPHSLLIFSDTLPAMHGHPATVVLAFHDITRLKRAEAELRAANRAKDEFLAMLAHELRNPLAPIRNAAYLLRLRGPEAPELQAARELIERQTHHLARLVDDLLDVSRIGRGKVELRKEVVDLAAVVNQAVETARPLLEERGHTLTVSLGPAPLRVHADATRLAQVVANLLSNAAKYTDRGGQIWLTAQRQDEEAVLRVQDTGRGIPPAMLAKVFDLFTQVDGSPGRAEGGLGIGLTLVKSLVEMHGGAVEALSDGPGQGSEFVVRLPVLVEEAEAGAPAAPPAGAPAGPSRRVLVVDDHHDAADSLALLLKMMGHEVRTAYDGPAALEAARSWRPEVVLLDIGLPGLSGYEVGRRLRDEGPGEELLIVALTGYGQDEDRRRSQEAGLDLHFVKPVDPNALRDLLAFPQPPKPGVAPGGRPPRK